MAKPPKAVIDHAQALFEAMGIPRNDFGVQHAMEEIVVFGGTNRLIAELREDGTAWDFRIDRPFMAPGRAACWDALSSGVKTLPT